MTVATLSVASGPFLWGDRVFVSVNITSLSYAATLVKQFRVGVELPDGWSYLPQSGDIVVAGSGYSSADVSYPNRGPASFPIGIMGVGLGMESYFSSDTILPLSFGFYATATKSSALSGFRLLIKTISATSNVVGSTYYQRDEVVVATGIQDPISVVDSTGPALTLTLDNSDAINNLQTYDVTTTHFKSSDPDFLFASSSREYKHEAKVLVSSGAINQATEQSFGVSWSGLGSNSCATGYTALAIPDTAFNISPQSGFLGTVTITHSSSHQWKSNTGAWISRSNSVSATKQITAPPAEQLPPAAPSNLSASDDGQNAIDLSWDDNSDNETAFYIYRAVGAAALAKVAQVGSNATSFKDVGLTANTTYRYAVSAYNSGSSSTKESALSAEDTATTDPIPPPPPPPNAPSGVTATPKSARSVEVAWTDNSLDEDSFVVGRSAASGGPYTAVAYMPEDATYWTDTDISPLTTIYYVVYAVNTGGSSVASNEASATTPEDPSNIMDATANFSLSPGARVSMRQVAGRLFVYSDLDRPLVFVNRRWFLQGIKPPLTAATTSEVAGGSLIGTFVVYICLYRSDDLTRSVPSPASTPITFATGKKIKVDPVSSGGKVTVRDIGYDQNGTQIDGADFWEIYITETGTMDGAYMVARLPITTTTWTCDAALAIVSPTEDSYILNGGKRPMEVNFESLIPPACAYSEFFNNRVVLFGEKTIDAPTGAKLTITNAATSFTVSGMTLTDNLYHKELYLNRRPTGWFVTDVVDGTTAYIKHSDPDTNSKGFDGTTGTYSIFAFAGKPGRFYASAYFSGEAAGGITFSPETFPPLTIFENELDPDDNQDPNGCIASRDSLFLFKPGKAFRITGGVEPDFPLYGVTPISRGSGLLASNTVCRDRDDNIYFLSDQGPHRARQTVIEKIGQPSRAAWMFQKLFDISSGDSAVGMWFSREDQFVVFGLNRVGSSGNRDGFIFDSRTNLVCPFTTPTRITACTQTQRDDGAYQIIVGDEQGRIGTFLTSGLWRDNRDYTLESPTWAEQGVSCYVQSGLLQDGRYISPQWWIPRLRAVPGGPFYYTIAFDAKVRSDDPLEFTSDFERTVRSSLTSRIYSKPKQMEACVLRLEFDTVKDSRIEFNQIDMAFNSYGAS